MKVKIHYEFPKRYAGKINLCLPKWNLFADYPVEEFASIGWYEQYLCESRKENDPQFPQITTHSIEKFKGITVLDATNMSSFNDNLLKLILTLLDDYSRVMVKAHNYGRDPEYVQHIRWGAPYLAFNPEQKVRGWFTKKFTMASRTTNFPKGSRVPSAWLSPDGSWVDSQAEYFARDAIDILRGRRL